MSEQHSPEPWVKGCWEAKNVGRKLYYEFTDRPEAAFREPEVWSGVSLGDRRHCSEKELGSPVVCPDYNESGVWINEADLDRAIVCVNACRGIPTEDLERARGVRPLLPRTRLIPESLRPR